MYEYWGHTSSILFFILCLIPMMKPYNCVKLHESKRGRYFIYPAYFISILLLFFMFYDGGFDTANMIITIVSGFSFVNLASIYKREEYSNLLNKLEEL